MKYVITGPHATNKFLVAQQLEEADERFSVAKYFSSNPKYQDLCEDNRIFLETLDVNQSYKNNALLTVSNVGGYFEGVTMDEFYANNVCVVELEDFNKISESVLSTNQILVVWIDSSNRNGNPYIQKDIIETKTLIDRLEFIDYIYFLNEDTDRVVETIQIYEGANDRERRKIREDFL